MMDAYQKMKYKSDVIFTGRLEVDELCKVVGAAFAMAYASYFEGFGIPIVEAIQCEIPVITSNVTSMPEVAGDAALLVDPFSVDSISCLLYTSDAADDLLCVDLGGRRII